MNRKRRFLLGTVLSIQNTGFTYPACQNCFSRVIHTADRYQCQKCSDTYQNATQRYRLCVKVSEDQKLHIITVFGSSVEKIFGSSANSLHRHLQESNQPSCDIEWDKAQQLLYQAAEDCLIGRSFIFAVKVPDDLHRDGSGNSSQLVACQIIPINDDHAVSILNRYHRLVEFISSNSMINTRHELSAQSTHRGFWDLTDSESSHSLHQSANQFADYWQQSLGLASSPTLNTSAETPSCSPSQSQANKGKSCEGERKFKEGVVLGQGNVKPTDHKVIVKDHLGIPNSSPLRVKSPLANIVDTCVYNQCPSPANRLSSRVSCQHHRHLQNVCNSNSYGCQDCSAWPEGVFLPKDAHS
ncbi:DNA damage-induced apoptosis suppressor protein isoform X2 [Rana temporaria]|uniref:DNA damage-induced apoptosis suppressor protein isoform X2 n=1 Tax=Rana temporaria TaxID=8407 RepID=UPI001AAE0871|nr:DNA damage-induced apoptosis suppressor protein isoform X2 [Rana temporaria]